MMELSSQTTAVVLQRHIPSTPLLSVAMRLATAPEETELAFFSTPAISGNRWSEYGYALQNVSEQPFLHLTYSKLQHKQRCSIIHLRGRSTSMQSERPWKNVSEVNWFSFSDLLHCMKCLNEPLKHNSTKFTLKHTISQVFPQVNSISTISV